MENDDLDLILANNEILLPSSGFAAAVMEAVHREAAAPAPIPFPWRRALPGLLVSVLVIISVLIGCVVRFGGKVGVGSAPAIRLTPILETVFKTPIGGMTLMLLLTFILVRIAFRFSGGEA